MKVLLRTEALNPPKNCGASQPALPKEVTDRLVERPALPAGARRVDPSPVRSSVLLLASRPDVYTMSVSSNSSDLGPS